MWCRRPIALCLPKLGRSGKQSETSRARTLRPAFLPIPPPGQKTEWSWKCPVPRGKRVLFQHQNSHAARQQTLSGFAATCGKKRWRFGGKDRHITRLPTNSLREITGAPSAAFSLNRETADWLHCVAGVHQLVFCGLQNVRLGQIHQHTGILIIDMLDLAG